MSDPTESQHPWEMNEDTTPAWKADPTEDEPTVNAAETMTIPDDDSPPPATPTRPEPAPQTQAQWQPQAQTTEPQTQSLQEPSDARTEPPSTPESTTLSTAAAQEPAMEQGTLSLLSETETTDVSTHKPTRSEQQAGPIAEHIKQHLDLTLTRSMQLFMAQVERSLQGINHQSTAALSHVATEIGSARETMRTEMEKVTSTLSTNIREFETCQETVLSDLKRQLTETLVQIETARTSILDGFQNTAKEAQKLAMTGHQQIQTNSHNLELAANTVTRKVYVSAIAITIAQRAKPT